MAGYAKQTENAGEDRRTDRSPRNVAMRLEQADVFSAHGRRGGADKKPQKV